MNFANWVQMHYEFILSIDEEMHFNLSGHSYFIASGGSSCCHASPLRVLRLTATTGQDKKAYNCYVCHAIQSRGSGGWTKEKESNL
jgi:hypothetical protein